jgi:hypothetical protein
MTRNFKIPVLTAVSIVILLSVFVFFSFRANRYAIKYGQVKIGQSKQSTIDLMGQESEKSICNPAIRSKYLDIDCSEIYAYYSTFTYRAIAFDKDEKVIKKYEWTFDDGYGKPHDFDK